MTLEPGVSVSTLVVPSKVETPPIVYLYNSTSTDNVPLLSIDM